MPPDTLPQLVKAIGYPGIFAVIFAESGLFFGFFLPGASLLFTAGLLASQGYFSPWILIPLVTFAAILGDSTGYWFGKKVGVSLFFKKDSNWFHHAHLERAKDFYDKHGVQTILLARFVPIVRTFAPILAGIVNMRYRTFLAYNVAGACTWGAGVTFLGYYLGSRVPFVGQYLTIIILVIIVISSIPLYIETAKAWRNQER
ncbi:DedA family protein [Candidatus Kaiserbacteria bacterium]|nr:DedA family protein [Candidatus Kaiserbacteria bacterium]